MPVRNERDLLPDLLGACAALDTRGITLALCLHLDGCSDDSAAIVARIAPALPFPVVCREGPRHPDANAGRARRAAMALGLERLGTALGGILLSTDADSRPEPRWLQAALRALDIADVAAGRLVRMDGDRDAGQTRVEHYYDRLHAHRRAIDPVPWDLPGGCHFGGGANLAMRAGAYRDLDGFRPVPCGEDALFLDDASRAGRRVRREPAMIVHTSSRRDGRAPCGLATALEEIDAHGLPRVVHPAAADWQYRAQALARDGFALLGDACARARLGAAIGLDADHVLGVGRDCPNAEAFAMRIVPAAAQAGRMVPLIEAEAALARLERDRREWAA